MSSKERMLSAKELFKYRTGLEQSMPSKGGIKDFMPDGSWLQDKCIENFHQERERAISEPRVLRSKDLVKGEWKPEVGLVELFHEMKNFWEHMGFNDKMRKWLHPEEALFLMETSILEIWYDGLPMSLQEVYSAFTGRIIQLELYQVYAYLRRVGYVVLRHRGRCLYTKYERKIGLHKFQEKNKNKGSKGDPSRTDIGKHEPTSESDKNMDVTDEGVSDVNGIHIVQEVRQCDEPSCYDTKQDTSDSREVIESRDGDKSCFMDIVCDGDKPVTVAENGLNKTMNEPKITDCDSGTKYSSWDFDEIVFPNFYSGNQVVNIHKPNAAYIPQGPNLDFCNPSYDYDKSKFINTKKEKKRNQLRDKESERNLEFSHPDVMTGWQKVKKSCRNWSEYKQAVVKEKQAWNRSKGFPHLYKDKVEPLVKPESASSTYSVLNQLQIIDDHKPNTGKSNTLPGDMLPDFDVYAPNTKFKKSSPGIPDFRVKVMRSDEPVPDIKTLTMIDDYLNDEVPLQWSVVDCGSISFYNMVDFNLPVDISLG